MTRCDSISTNAIGCHDMCALARQGTGELIVANMDSAEEALTHMLSPQVCLVC
jgi:hypothetical protein